MIQKFSIQYVRALAALAVVFYHAMHYSKIIAGAGGLHSAIGGIPGNIGVIAFFILSGYLMVDIAHKYEPVTFLWHRILRIYPIYWLCVVAATALYFLLWLYVVGPAKPPQPA